MEKQNRLTSMLKIYKRVIQEIEIRDLSDVATEKLIQLSVLINQKINEQNASIEIGYNAGNIIWESGEFFNLNTLE